MSALVRALSAEAMKLRGTLALWMCLIAPATVVGLLVLQISFSDLSERTPLPPAEAWQSFVRGALTFWAFLMLPLFVTLESALLAGLEHASQQWKHLLALPLPRSAHYLAKLIALAALVVLAMLALLVLVPIGGWAVMQLQPRAGIGGTPPWETLLNGLAACLAATGLMLALHTWIAIRWRSFTVAVAAGMTATVCGFLIGQSERFGPWYPWSLPLHALVGEDGVTGPVMLLGVLGGGAVGAAALWDLLRRDTD